MIIETWTAEVTDELVQQHRRGTSVMLDIGHLRPKYFATHKRHGVWMTRRGRLASAKITRIGNDTGDTYLAVFSVA